MRHISYHIFLCGPMLSKWILKKNFFSFFSLLYNYHTIFPVRHNIITKLSLISFPIIIITILIWIIYTLDFEFRFYLHIIFATKLIIIIPLYLTVICKYHFPFIKLQFVITSYSNPQLNLLLCFGCFWLLCCVLCSFCWITVIGKSSSWREFHNYIL